MNHFLSIDQFNTPDNIIKLFHKASSFHVDGVIPDHYKMVRTPYKMASLFFEPSTRTRLSFETAMLNIGGSVITVSDSDQCSGVKGESLEDAITTISNYADVIVLRHSKIGAAAEAAAVSSVPVINAGDGAGEHPTQAMLDAYTIYKHFKTLSGLNILFAGDLMFSRTVKSLVKLLSIFGHNKFHTLPINENAGLRLQEVSRFPDNIDQTNYPNSNLQFILEREKIDVVYLTRPQRERWTGKSIAESQEELLRYQISGKHLPLLKPEAIIMHPLPRNHEICVEVDKDPRAVYFKKQIQAGVFVRMAILQTLLMS